MRANGKREFTELCIHHLRSEELALSFVDCKSCDTESLQKRITFLGTIDTSIGPRISKGKNKNMYK